MLWERNPLEAHLDSVCQRAASTGQTFAKFTPKYMVSDSLAVNMTGHVNIYE